MEPGNDILKWQRKSGQNEKFHFSFPNKNGANINACDDDMMKGNDTQG